MGEEWSSDTYEPWIERNRAEENRTCTTHDETKDVWRSNVNGEVCVQGLVRKAEGVLAVENPMMSRCDLLVTSVTSVPERSSMGARPLNCPPSVNWLALQKVSGFFSFCTRHPRVL